MKKFPLVILSAFATFILGAGIVSGQMMRFTPVPADDHTVKEEKEGKALFEKLQAKEITCTNLSDEDFERLGEYFMGQMLGDTGTHAAMNEMMTRMMDEQGESQMHIVMGKRLSGCDTQAAFPRGGLGFAPMMQMMSGWQSSGWGMMGNWWGGVGVFAAFVALLWTTVLPLAVLALLVLWIIKLWQQVKK